MKFSDLYELKMEKQDITLLHLDGREPEKFKDAYCFSLVPKKRRKIYTKLEWASKSAEKEKAEQERVIEITEKFIRCLEK